MPRFLRSPYTFATAGNYPAGSDVWAGTTRIYSPSSAELGVGYTPNTPITAQYANYLESVKADAIAVQGHNALQSWRVSSVDPSNANFRLINLIGARSSRSFDANGEMNRLPWILGQDSASTAATQYRSGDASIFSAGTISPTYVTPMQAFPGEAGVVVLSSEVGAVNWLYSTDLGSTWAAAVGFGENPYNGHYCAASGRYLGHGPSVVVQYPNVAALASGTSGVNFVTPTGVTSLAIHDSEFHDNGGLSVILIAKVNGNAFSTAYYSSNGGFSWAKGQDFPGRASGTYNAALGLFFARDSLGNVYTSSTGQAWALISTAATAAAGFQASRFSMASAGPAIACVASVSTGNNKCLGVAYSLDAAAHWNFSYFADPAYPLQLRGFNNRIYATDTFRVWASGTLAAPLAEI